MQASPSPSELLTIPDPSRNIRQGKESRGRHKRDKTTKDPLPLLDFVATGTAAEVYASLIKLQKYAPYPPQEPIHPPRPRPLVPLPEGHRRPIRAALLGPADGPEPPRPISPPDDAYMEKHADEIDELMLLLDNETVQRYIDRIEGGLLEEYSKLQYEAEEEVRKTSMKLYLAQQEMLSLAEQRGLANHQEAMFRSRINEILILRERHARQSK